MKVLKIDSNIFCATIFVPGDFHYASKFVFVFLFGENYIVCPQRGIFGPGGLIGPQPCLISYDKNI